MASYQMRTYLAALTIYENNFRVLHWKMCGPGFHVAHERFGTYYDTLGTFMDQTAEAMISIGDSPVNLMQAIEILQSDSIPAIVIGPEDNYSVDAADTAAKDMFTLLYSMSSQLAEETEMPADIADIFMDHARYYRLENNYKLGRRFATASNS